MKKILCALLALVTVLSFAACGKTDKPTATDAKGQVVKADVSKAAGTLMLSSEDYCTLYYNKAGKVIAIINSSADSIYEELNGKTCVQAVGEILKDNDLPVVDRRLLVKQSPTSETPNASFMEDIVAEAKKVLGESVTVISCTAAQQGEMGYFPADVAEALVAAYVGVPADAAHIVSDSDSGYFEVSVTTANGYIANYRVGAYYGRIDEIPNYEESIVEEMPDYFVDDGFSMDYTDYVEEDLVTE